MPLYADQLAVVNDQRAAVTRQKNTLQRGLIELQSTLTEILQYQGQWAAYVQAGNMDVAELARYQEVIAQSVSLQAVADAVKALGIATGGAVAAVACVITDGEHSPIQTSF